jgi:hypothetical protein
MDNKRKIPDLQHESLKKQPFSVPDGYFESFSDSLQARIREEENTTPVRRITIFTRPRVAMAAAILSLALISYSILRFVVPNYGPSSPADVALIDEFYLMEDDDYLVEYMESEEEEMNDEEAFANQAMDYLAINDVEMILLLE